MNKKKIAILIIIGAIISLWFVFDLGKYLNLAYIKSQQEQLQAYIVDAPMVSSLTYFFAYVLIAALSFPGAAIFTLLGGALFGFWWGLVIISFASTIGATLAFLISRYLLGNWVQRNYGYRLQSINQGIEKQGAFYLFTLRLIPVVPFFMINLLMGLTTFKTRTFFWVSQLGMLAGTGVYVNAGTQLGQLSSLSGILSPAILFSFALLGIFPLIAKQIVEQIHKKRVYKKWHKPASFDRNLVVIGAGSGGLVTAYIAAATKAKVTLIEKDKMGGDCLNTGCVPSKAIIRAAHSAEEVEHAKYFGISSENKRVDFATVMRRVHDAISQVEPHDSVERYTSLGVECLQGEAHIISPWEVEINGQRLTSKNIVIASGAAPIVPQLENLDQVSYYTSDTIWQLREQPKRFLVIGGGPIGCELSQSFARLGSDVTLVNLSAQLLAREDKEAGELIAEHLTQDGVEIKSEQLLVAVKREGDKQQAQIKDKDNNTYWIEFDALLFALGRKANTQGFGLQELGIELNKNGTIKVNDYLQTNYPNIYAVGDVAGPYQLTHAASHQAWYASVNALFGAIKRFKADYSILPAVTYCSPEVATVGLTQKQADEQKIAYEVTRFDFAELDRAIADHEAYGFVKVLTRQGSDKILGVTIVATHAGNLLAEFTLAMRHGLGLNKILATIHPYPTWSEANKYVAGAWKKEHVSESILKISERFHAWQRR